MAMRRIAACSTIVITISTCPTIGHRAIKKIVLHVLDLLSSIRDAVASTAVGTVDWQVKIDKTGEGLVAYKL